MPEQEKSSLNQAASAAHTVHSAIKTGKAFSTAAIDEILAEGIADAQARAAQDFASTGGDNYEIVQPFTVSSNTNSFIGQYCAAKEQSWAEISLEDLKQLLRAGKSHLYSFTRTSETRTVEADDPASTSRSQKAWDLSIILNEAGAGGPFWLIG